MWGVMKKVIRTDRRTIEYEPAPEAVAKLDRLGPAYLDLQLQMGRALAEIDRKNAYVEVGCTSIAQFGQRHAIPPAEVFALVSLGRALHSKRPADPIVKPAPEV
jgi:hypothetical protein